MTGRRRASAARRRTPAAVLAAIGLLAAAVTVGVVVHPGLSSGAPAATTRYVSCSGHDRAAGTAADTAWRTLTRANRAALAPGSRLLLKRGCTWDGQRLEARWAGTAARPVRITAYGDPRLPRPRIRNGPHENVLVTGSHLVISSLSVGHDVRKRTSCGQPVGDYVGFELAHGAHDVTLVGSRATGEMAGARLEASTKRVRVLRNQFVGNGVLQPHRELGAWGVLVDGDFNEVAWNEFRDNRSTCRMRSGRYASNSVELYSGSHNRIHHNRSTGDRVFSELGSSSARTSQDNVYSYNLFVSRLTGSRFITTRGAKDKTFGPVLGTQLTHNTTYQTGADSQGVVCGSGCSTAVLGMRANIIWAQTKIVYSDGPFRAADNIGWASGGSPVVQTPTSSLGPGNRLANPRFTRPAAGDFTPAATSPAVDADPGPPGFPSDVLGTPLPSGGPTDTGAIERRPNGGT